MPNKGGGLLYGERYNPINKKLYKRFIEKYPSYDIDYKTFKEIIETNNEIIKDSIIEEEAGIKLPEGLGHIVVTKYKSKKIPTDWINTLKHNKIIPLLNLHSYGYIHHIKWFKVGMRLSNLFVYKFHYYRTFKRKLAKTIKEGKKYFSWQNSDFWSMTKMERRFEKFYNKNKENDNSGQE